MLPCLGPGMREISQKHHKTIECGDSALDTIRGRECIQPPGTVVNAHPLARDVWPVGACELVGGKRDREPEGRAFAERALDSYLSMHLFDELATDE